MQTASIEFFRNGTGTSTPRQWPGGRGFFAAVGTGFGTVSMECLGPDGVTWLQAPAISLSANGGVVFDLPPGTVRGVCNTTTNVYATATRITS